MDKVEISEDIKAEVEWDESTSTTERVEEMEVIAAAMEEEAAEVEGEDSVGPIPPKRDLDSKIHEVSLFNLYNVYFSAIVFCLHDLNVMVRVPCVCPMIYLH